MKNKTVISKETKKRKLKHGAVAAMLTAAAIVAVVLFNIAASAISEKVNLSLDLSSAKDFTLTENIKAFIENDVTKEITITVCSEKDDYTNGLYLQVLSNFGYGDSSSGTFFKQTVYLLDAIDNLSDKITVNYVDPLDPVFSLYTNKYNDLAITMGDILVESTYEQDGEEVTRHKLLNVSDIYKITDVASYYGESYVYVYNCNYYIEGNNVETAIGSAIYSVTSDKSYKVAVVTANGGEYVEELDEFMSANNYEFKEVSNLYDENNSIDDDTDIIIISAPKSDYKKKELEIIDNYLSNNDSQYKTVLYIASANQPELPNLNEFLGEWGFVVNPDTVLAETDNAFIRGENDTNIQFSPVSTSEEAPDTADYFDGISATADFDYIATNSACISLKDNLSNDHGVRSILSTSENAAAKPLDADENWKPEDNKKGEHIGFGVGYSTTLLNNYDYYDKRVMVLSSIDFIQTSYNQYEECGNLNIIMSALDVACGKNSKSVVFDTRTFNTDTFTTPTDFSVNVMMSIFVIAIPLIILVTCVVIAIRRRHL